MKQLQRQSAIDTALGIVAGLAIWAGLVIGGMTAMFVVWKAMGGGR